MLMPRATTSPLTNAAQMIMGGIEKRKQEEKTAQLNQLMGGALTGDAASMEQLAQADPNAFMAVQQHQAQQDLTGAQTQKAMLKPSAGAMKPEDLQKANTMKNELMNNIALLPIDQQQKALADANAEFKSVWGDSLAFPESIDNPVVQRKFQQINEKADEIANKAAAEIKTGLEDKWAGNFSKIINPMLGAEGMSNTVKGLLNDNKSGIADQAAIIGLFKILDPTSVVSQAEGETIVASQSIPDTLASQINKWITGEKFEENGKEDFLKTVDTLLNNRRDMTYNQVQMLTERGDMKELDRGAYMGSTQREAYEKWLDEKTPKIEKSVSMQSKGSPSELEGDELVNYYLGL